MDIRILKYFIKIADTQGITAAAKELNISQPPLSNQLKALEEELGVPLFVRKNKRFLLTKEGEILYNRAKKIVSDFDSTVYLFDSIKLGMNESLVVGSFTAGAIKLLPSLIKKLKADFPSTQFQIIEKSGIELMRDLDDGVIELALLKEPFNKELYDYIYIDSLLSNSFESELCVVAPKELIPEDCTLISLEDLIPYPLIIHDVQRSHFQDVCRRQNIHPDFMFTNVNILTSLIWCKEQMGVAIMSFSSAQISENMGFADKLRILPLKGFPAVKHSALVWRFDRPLSNTGKAFIAEVKKRIAEKEKESEPLK